MRRIDCFFSKHFCWGVQTLQQENIKKDEKIKLSLMFKTNETIATFDFGSSKSNLYIDISRGIPYTAHGAQITPTPPYFYLFSCLFKVMLG